MVEAQSHGLSRRPIDASNSRFDIHAGCVKYKVAYLVVKVDGSRKWRSGWRRERIQEVSTRKALVGFENWPVQWIADKLREDVAV